MLSFALWSCFSLTDGLSVSDDEIWPNSCVINKEKEGKQTSSGKMNKENNEFGLIFLNLGLAHMVYKTV